MDEDTQGNPDFSGGDSVTAALAVELSGMSVEVQRSSLAALCLALAGRIDAGDRVPDCSRELRQCLVQLRDAGLVGGSASGPDELARAREERRSG